jgi:hypothetical protein
VTRPLPEVIAEARDYLSKHQRSQADSVVLLRALVDAAEAHVEEMERRSRVVRRGATDLVARLSEAKVAVPEPLAVGEVQDLIGGDRCSLLKVTVDGFEDYRHLVKQRVGIWPADLAERVCDHALDEEGWRRERDAALAVAKRFRDGWKAVEGNDGVSRWVWSRGLGTAAFRQPEPNKPLTNAETRVLDLLEESNGD